MYDHPYLTYQVSTIDTQRAAEAAERRRIIAENPSRVIAREGEIARMLRRVVRARSGRTAVRAEAPCPTGTRCVALEA